MTLYEQMLEEFPLGSYEEERTASGCVSLKEETEVRKLAEGVTYRKRCYQRGDGRGVTNCVIVSAFLQLQRKGNL